jgi:hypothetical protein
VLLSPGDVPSLLLRPVVDDVAELELLSVDAVPVEVEPSGVSATTDPPHAATNRTTIEPTLYMR